jgi:hypothetical protein
VRLLPTLAGVLLIGAEGYVLNEAMWEPVAQQGACLVPLARCEPYRLIANSEPKPDRMNPASRVRVWLVRDGYLPADSNLDGFVRVDDAALFTASPWDFNNDGMTDGADLAAYIAEYARPCPRLTKEK